MPEETKPSTPENQPTQNRNRLRVSEKLAVGTGGLTVSLGNQSVRTTGQAVLNMILGINAFWVGVVLAIPLLWDAITDPIMGNISDNFKSKYGRRRPFIFIGAILMGASFASIWLIPMDWSDAGKLAWFLVTSLLFYTAYTIFSVPFIGLTYEMTSDYDERTEVQGYVTFWNRLGEMTYMGLIPLSLTFIAWKYGYGETGDLINEEKIEGIRIAGATYGFLGMTLFGIVPAFFAKERLYEVNLKEQKGKRDPFWQSASLALQNKAFLILCLLAVFTIIAGVFASNMDWYLLIFYLSDGDITLGTQWKLIVTVGYAIVGIIGIPLIVWITGKMSKIQGFMFVYGMMVLNAIIRWFVYQPGRFNTPLSWSSPAEWLTSLGAVFQSLLWLDPLTGGTFWIGVGVLGQSLIADICDDDELKHGHRREGMFGAIYGWSTKASFALSFVLIGVFLTTIGFDPQWGSTRYLQLNATAANYSSTTADFAVTDDESETEATEEESSGESILANTLSLSLAQTHVNEKDKQTLLTISRNNTEGALIVNLKSSDTSIAKTTQSITIPDGQSSVETAVSIIDDSKTNGVRTTTITAWAKAGKPARTSLHVIDDDGPALSLIINGYEMSENGGHMEATITRNNTTSGALKVLLKTSSDEDSEVPASVTIPDGEHSASFTISGIDNDRVDGQQTEQTFFNMRLAMCLGAALPALLCFVLLYFYPLSKAKSEENRQKLDALRGEL